MRSFLLSILFVLLPAASAIHATRFKSGERYQIRCIEYPAGCVVPSPDDPLALRYTEKPDDNIWWTITQERDGHFTIRHTKSGRYMTFDGERTANRRYMHLGKEEDGERSHWLIYPGRTALIICNAAHGDHLLNLRRPSFIVGTYRNTTGTATDNERFFLTDKKGRTVTRLGDEVKLPFLMNLHDAPSPAVPKRHAGNRPAPERLRFTLDGRSPAYDRHDRFYLYSLAEKETGDFSARIKVQAPTQGRLFIDGKEAGKGGRCTFHKPENGHVFRLAWVSGNDTLSAAALTFTYLPVVEISGTGFDKSQFRNGTFRLSAPEQKDTCTLRARLRYRGDYTTLFSKKSFAVKLTDAAGRALDRQLLGMRSDNYWILDAMVVDPARMRNRVAMDLWNDFSTRPARARTSLNGVRGRLVEVFLNGRYHGVYNLCERVDRKQLGLEKPDRTQTRGCLYKSRQWDAWTLLGFNRQARRPAGTRPPACDDRSGQWGLWELKYPKHPEAQTAVWQPLYEAIALCSAASDKTFSREVAARFDLPVVRDYYLFIELLHATDNSGKNLYWYTCDQAESTCLTPVPWDLDGTFGRDWAGHRSGCRAEADFRSFLLDGGRQNALFERLHRLNPADWNSRLARRYRELRRTHFAPERLFARFERYFRLLERSGADRRETKRWKHENGSSPNFKVEADYLRHWLDRRVATLDAQYGYR